MLRSNRHHSSHFQHAWNKYGEDDFVFEVIFILYNSSESRLRQLEEKLLVLNKARNLLYNTSISADGSMSGFKQSEETKLKRSLKMTGHAVSQITRDKIAAAHKGKKLSPDRRAKAAIAMLGKKHSEETKQRMSASRSGDKNYFKGCKRTNADKQRISELTKAAMTPERCKKVSEAQEKPVLVWREEWDEKMWFPSASKAAIYFNQYQVGFSRVARNLQKSAKGWFVEFTFKI